ncbi:MAG: DUF3365 domain-containing protein [Oceanicoccus sp.]|uniref:c-type heme family protein n=1 Tax=Oceanicoccus sp. TaxID=2691044 RepID=UPI0026397B13|nr:DUF3365 domain-containing protein [Oceanicoccus sp.]MCP3908277.1 DUF3365 domain-containing protein [Oceanicoccus sp.]
MFFSISITVLFGGFVFYSLSPNESDADIVNMAGRQRMLSQAMSKSVLGYSVVHNTLQATEARVSELDRYISKMRGIYTGVVIGAAKKSGIKISMHPTEESTPAIPFPATFARMVGEKFTADGNFSIEILAEDPVNPKQGLKDDIDREAFKALSSDKKQLFFRDVEQDGKHYLRYYSADTAVVEECAFCHTGLCRWL